MSENNVDKGRRRFLLVTTSVVGGAGMVMAAIPFLQSWQPSERARAAGAPVEVPFGRLTDGELLMVEWQGKPIMILKRSSDTVAQLASIDEQLRDPASDDVEQQPGYAKNEYRSVRPELLVAIANCTHLGCIPEYVPKVGPQPYEANWIGGFFCPCHKSKFDLAGRVYKSVPAPKNLAIPPHSFLGGDLLLLGVEPTGDA